MALYDYECPRCHHVAEQRHSMHETPKIPCPLCKERMTRVILQAPHMFMDTDWSRENGGRGRFNPQLSAHVKGVADTIEQGKRRGMEPV